MAELELRDFRNYEACRMEPAPGLNLVVGANGQGKTNLLEAFWLLTGTRSPRAAHPELLIRRGAGAARVRGRVLVEQSGAEREVEVRLQRHPASRSVVVNGKLYRRAWEAVGALVAVWVAPDAAEVVRGPGERRRHFLDVALAQLDGIFREAALRYSRILVQRNRLLARGGEAASGPLLEVYDEQLARLGAVVAERRRRLVERLEPVARELHGRLAGQEEPGLELAYRPCVQAEEGPAGYERALRLRLQELRAAELARGVTLAGPHRDELYVGLGGMDLRRLGSRGQQRTAALALHLALWHCVAQRLGEAPLLLVDDAASELDEGRRARLFQVLPQGAQVVVSATEAELMGLRDGLHGQAAVWRVSDGRLQGPAG